MNNTQLPESYAPHKSLFFCSLIIYNYKILFNIDGMLPLLIGNGDKPRIWLQTIINGTPLRCIEDNVILQKQFDILYEKNITVKASTHILLTISESNIRHAEIQQIDLRPIGLNIYGDMKGLSVGGSLFSNLTFQDVETLFALQNK